jgi:eukaryotic-like serine/threonine-protein kinase
MKKVNNNDHVMTPQRFQEIRELFEDLVSLDPEERAAALNDVRGGDPLLASEAEVLLAVADRDSTFIQSPVIRPNPSAERGALEGIKGASIGPYQLETLIGQGGMGQVWRAQQKWPVQRTVALKLIKAGMDTYEVMRRFESERQALALMEHPAIAKVFDAGTTSRGRPYFVMEYVEGIPITTYCDRHRLTIRERLKLFVKVCEGIQHAHRKAIIHRDIKPSNILVMELDGKPQPKIIDFGLARAFSIDDDEHTALTRMGALLGTPDYMSPEQATSVSASIDTRTDVFSLGVVLHELLVGVLPRDLRGLSMVDLLRKMSEDQSPRPSSNFRAKGLDPAVAQNRRLSPSALLAELRGDLDAIATKALENDPANRYGSPMELAEELRRHLEHQPVEARKTSPFYVARKYIRRHLATVSALAATILLLAAFGGWQNFQLRRITRERDRADRITEFMTEMFRVADPTENGGQVTAREILDRATARIDTGLARDPEMRGKLMDVMGQVYGDLGLYPQAESLLRKSVEVSRRTLGPEALETAEAVSDLATALSGVGKLTEARKLDEEALQIRERALGPNHLDTLKSMNNLAVDLVDEGLYNDAALVQTKVLAARQRLLGAEDPSTLMAMENLGDTMGRIGHYATAEKLKREALAIKQRTLGARHPETLRSLQALAETLCDLGRFREAEVLDREALSGRTAIFGPEHVDTLKSLISLGNTLEGQGRLSEAETAVSQALKAEQRSLPENNPDVLLARNNLAGIWAKEGRLDEAEPLARSVVALRSQTLGPTHPDTIHSTVELASILMMRRSLDEAEQVTRTAQEAGIKALGENHPDTALLTYTMASITALKGDRSEALSLLRQAIDQGLIPNVALSMAEDKNLTSLRGVPAFQDLLVFAKQRAATE